ncbi:MAG: V-type ATP synthase subunit D [Polyangiaceae bacterium]
MATRTELLALRAQIERAAEGRDLLRDKRTELLAVFRDVADAVLAESDALAEAGARASQALARAEALAGREAIGSAGLTAKAEIDLAARERHVMGVSFAEITGAPVGRPRTARGYSLSGTPVSVDEVAGAFEGQLQLLVKMATEELRLRRLARELQKVSRRVNALEHIIIPGLLHRARATRATLDEREREARFVRQRLARRKHAAGRLA